MRWSRCRKDGKWETIRFFLCPCFPVLNFGVCMFRDNVCMFKWVKLKHAFLGAPE